MPMSLRFSGERLTPDVLSASIRDQLRFVRERGLTTPFGLLYGKEDHLARYKFVVKENIVEGKRILDIGCGIGYGVGILKDGQTELAVGIDKDYPSTRYGQETYGFEGLGFAQAYAEHLPFAPDSFDVVVSLEAIEHLENPKAFLNEAHRVLTEDGVFIISTPNREITNPGTSLEDKPKNKFHLREYSKEEFKELLEKYFGTVELFGQYNPQKDKRGNPLVRRIKLLGNLVRLEDVVKVVSLKENQEPSGIVAVCKNKKQKK